MNDRLTYAALEKKLLRLGFEKTDVRGSHLLFRHRQSDSLIMLPHRRPKEIVSPLHLLTVRKVLTKANLLTPERLAHQVEQIVAENYPGVHTELATTGIPRRVVGKIVWEGFRDQDTETRQKTLWQVLEQQLLSEELIKIALLMTTAPGEAA